MQGAVGVHHTFITSMGGRRGLESRDSEVFHMCGEEDHDDEITILTPKAGMVVDPILINCEPGRRKQSKRDKKSMEMGWGGPWRQG